MVGFGGGGCMREDRVEKFLRKIVSLRALDEFFVWGCFVDRGGGGGVGWGLVLYLFYSLD